MVQEMKRRLEAIPANAGSKLKMANDETKTFSQIEDDIQLALRRKALFKENDKVVSSGFKIDSVPKTPGNEVRHHDNLGFNNELNSQKVPYIELPDDLFEEGLNPWKFSLIGRLDLQHIKFVDAAIILRFIKSSQWEVLNQVLQVRNWISNFRPSKQSTSKAQVWVRFPGLGLEFCKEKILFTIYKEIGTPIKIDTATAKYEVEYYTNVLVENKRSSECKASPKPRASVKIPQTPFDICDRTMVESSASKVQTSTSNSVIQSNSEENSVVLNIATPVSHPPSSEEPTVVVELYPSKLLQIAEVTELENSVVKFIDAGSGKVTTEPVPFTSWSSVVKTTSGIKNVNEGAKKFHQSGAQLPWHKSNNEEVKTVVQGNASSEKTINPVTKKYNFRRNDGMQSMVIHNEVNNHKGNIWLFWSSSIATPSVVSISSQMITVVVGDVLVSAEKVGGRAPSRISMTDFNDCVNSCELLQAPKIVLDFSWSNCQQGSQRILCNLDRSVFNMQWLQMFGDWGYKVGLRVASDHASLLGGCASVPKPENAPLRFQKMWLEHPTFMEVVKNSWAEEIHGDAPYIFMTKLKHLKHILKEWNWKVFGDVKLKIQEAEDNVKAKMIHSDARPHNEQALEDLVAAQNEFNSREVQYNTMLKQKYRIKWVKEGSANTNFFHTNIKIRKTRNSILELEDDNGNLISDQKKIADTLVDFFEKRYQYQEVEVNDSILESIPKLITENDQFMLEVIPEADEIKAAVFEMDGDSAPGPDSFSGAKQPNQFRPIGLSNFSFKVFTKILSMRMASLMKKLVSPQQVAYIKGRRIHEKVLLASKLVNEMKKEEEGRKSWCDWLKELLSSAKISVMVNEGPNCFFSMHRGLKQGDPLSPILFVLMEEVLSKKLQNMVEKNKLQPMVIRNGIALTHLLFADDVSIFCNGSKKNSQNLLLFLEDYQTCSGQVFNRLKSKCFIDGCSIVQKNQISNTLQIDLTSFPDKYLGVIIHSGRIKTATVWPMVEMM
ncbi:uncharacterized protein LOC113332915 [Papaver somniferum]|uniref:uncharacterized protein LOC113332915 n=1 Tax=Papaver somniferum TaxID=3469 RepID=UPI000E6FA6A0|nr:uncharacterized protein LOC113332915 [Papaver somniferum]